MDVSPIVNVVWSYIWWLLAIGLLATFFKSAWFKGWLGERFVRWLASWQLPADIYHPVHDVTLTTLDGTTQIDHVFVSRFGIFVVETKNMGGWIFGSEHQAQWTQRFHRKSFRFQNPLRQNYKHVKALEAVTGLPLDALHSVIVFMGAAKLKTAMPANVTQGAGYIRHIKSYRDEILTEEQVASVLEAIQAARLAPSLATSRQHVQKLKERSNPDGDRRCPSCGNKMVLRTASKGANAGKRFWGCSSFPKCRVMQKID